MKLKALFRRRLGKKPKNTSKNKSNATKKAKGSKKSTDAGNTNGKADVAQAAAPPTSPAKGTPARKTAPPPASPTSVAAAISPTSDKSQPAAAEVEDFNAKVFQQRKEDIEAAREAGPVDLDDDQDDVNADADAKTDNADTTKGGKTEEEQYVSDLIESLAVALPKTEAAGGGKAAGKKAPKKSKKNKRATGKNAKEQKDKSAAVDANDDNNDATKKKEAAEEKVEEVRDYDTNVTRLFAYLHQRKWTRAVEHIITEEGRREASVWVARYQQEEEKKNSKEEKKGEEVQKKEEVQQQKEEKKLLWKLLPIHAAIIYNAPPEVVQIVIRKYPDGCRRVDDRGCTPLHLAVGKGVAGAQILAMLVRACPDAVDAADERGRTPLGMAEELPVESSRRADYLDILRNKNVGIEEVLLDRMTTDDVSMVSADSMLQTSGGGGGRGRNCAGFCFDDDSGDELTMSGWSCNDSAWFPGCESDGYDDGQGEGGNDPSKSGCNNCVKDITILEEIAEICSM